MTQTGGIDILIAWVEFAAILLVFGWLLLRHHRNVRRLSREDLDREEQQAREAGPRSFPPGAREGR
ncbi:MAG: hypothetical protein ACTHJJ_05955 [Intrasporangium sp.]|uniref:hypothetical protein n=1 Tax=Intrasporangium sp. TaxID=1925024 RepID=UPI003F7E1961